LIWKNSSWKIQAALFTLLALLTLSAVTPALGHSTNRSSHPFASAYSYDPISTGNWQQDQYDSIIVQLSQSRNLDPFIVKGVIMLESGFNTYASSRVPNSACAYTHDLGLMQLNPYCDGLGSVNLFDPWTNVYYGTAFLQGDFNMFGDTSLALQAYNLGPIQVENGVRNWAYSGEVLAYAQQFRDEHAANYGGPVSTPDPPTSSSNSYTVQPGDYLYLIGQKTGVNWQTIAFVNGISYPYIIHPGEVLQLTGATSSSTWTYTIRPGDTLYLIGERYGVSWQQIAQQNGISYPYLIYVGQSIQL
jgi:LysM repeat protein